MTEKSASDILRKLLDERGVEHEDYAYVIPETQERCEVTRIKDYAGRFKARFMSCNTPGKIDVIARLTPEQAIAATLGSEREAELVRAMEDVLRHSTDTVWVGEAETLVDRMVSLGVYKHDVYEGVRPWEVTNER